jgi:hypothetical protein
MSLMFTFMLGWNKCKYYLASACIYLLIKRRNLNYLTFQLFYFERTRWSFNGNAPCELNLTSMFLSANWTCSLWFVSLIKSAQNRITGKSNNLDFYVFIQVLIWIFKIWFRSTCYDRRNWDIMSLMFTFMLGDKVWIIELTLIHKNIRSVHNLTHMCMFIYQSDVKHIMTSPTSFRNSCLLPSDIFLLKTCKLFDFQFV